MEVWNEPEWVQQPLPGTENEDGITYWQCMLDLGWHVTATGGSDSHWLSTIAVQGVGNPTTWVLATERSARGVLDAIKNGRTAISAVPPTSGGAPLLLEADRDHDGTFESTVGDTVTPGSPLQVRSLSPVAAGVVELHTRSGVRTGQLTPGGVVSFTPGATDTWAWARLLEPEGVDVRKAQCDPLVGDQTTYCRQPLAQVAMTAAIYFGTTPEPTATATATATPSPTETSSPTPTPCPTKKNGKPDKGCPTAPAAAAALRPAAFTGSGTGSRTPVGLGLGLAVLLGTGSLLLARGRRRHLA
jgi:hypothetical protein